MERLRTIDKKRLKEHIGTLSSATPTVDKALSISLGIDESRQY